MRFAVLLVCICIMAGCQSISPYPMPQVQPIENILPAASIIVNDGRVFSQTNCVGYACSTYVDETHLKIRDTIVKSGIFKRVDLNNAHDEIKLYVQFKNMMGVGDVLHFPKVMFGAVTLFLVPIKFHFKYEAQFDVVYKDQYLKKYKYDLTSDSWTSSFGPTGKDMHSYAAESITLNFLNDIQTDNLLNEFDVVNNTAENPESN